MHVRASHSRATLTPEPPRPGSAFRSPCRRPSPAVSGPVPPRATPPPGTGWPGRFGPTPPAASALPQPPVPPGTLVAAEPSLATFAATVPVHARVPGI